MKLIRDKHGKLTGIIREIAGGEERLHEPTGRAVATYKPVTNATYDVPNGVRLGTGNRLAGMVEDEE